jgi:hypothetical protein
MSNSERQRLWRQRQRERITQANQVLSSNEPSSNGEGVPSVPAILFRELRAMGEEVDKCHRTVAATVFAALQQACLTPNRHGDTDDMPPAIVALFGGADYIRAVFQHFERLREMREKRSKKPRPPAPVLAGM